MARRFASLDHLSGGRSAWNVVTSWDAFTGENFRRGGFLAQDERYARAGQFLRTTWELFDSWHGDEIVADKESGRFLREPNVGAFEHHDGHFDIAGQFNVPRSPQGRPVIFQAGDSNEGREFAASAADVIFGRHATLKEGKAFYADAIATLDYVTVGRGGWRAQVSRSADAALFGRRQTPVFSIADYKKPEVQAAVGEYFDEAADYVEVVRRIWDSWEDDAEIQMWPPGGSSTGTSCTTWTSRVGGSA